MEKNNNIKLIGIFASILLLVIVVTASFAYFGSFDVNLNNNVAVNVNAYSPGDATFISNATQLNLQVPAANMSQLLNGTLAAENTATLSVNLTGAEGLLTTCTYDIVYEYDSSSYIYGGTGTNHVSKNGDKEITLQVTNVNGTNNFASEKNFDYDSNWNGLKRTLVSGATISSTGSLTTQNINITGRFYNLSVSQSSIGENAFTGKIYVTNHKCETSDEMSITTLMSTSTADVYDENGLRYEGADPNNYICLDNKAGGSCSDSSLLFRIIGLFDEEARVWSTNQELDHKVLKLLKVIDTNNYGGISGKYWDEDGTSNWSSASLKKELNGTYMTTLLGTSNVNSKLSSAIANAKWHLGGASDSNYDTLTAEGIYTEERKTYDTFGYIGLMYPSDYGYATVGSTTTYESSCRELDLFEWGDSSYSDCKNNNWLFTSQSSFVNEAEWLLSPNANYEAASAAFLGSYGRIDLEGQTTNYSQFAVRPAFYLDSSILKIVGTGDGTKDNAYRVG